MAMEVQIQAPDDELSVQVVQDLLAEKDKFTQAGISLSHDRLYRFLPGVAEAIVVCFIGEVVSHYAIKLVDALVGSIRRRKHYSVPAVVKHGSMSFALPRDYDECILYFRNLKGGRPHE